jgi:hypothetical protein
MRMRICKKVFKQMKRVVILTVLLILTSNVMGQKLYIWCPHEQKAIPRQGFLVNDTIDLVFFDGRIISDKSKIDCTSEKLINDLQRFVRDSYSSAYINFLNKEDFFKNPELNRITIKIGITAYHAAFGADIKIGIGSIGGNFSYGVIPEGKWNGMTGYSVKIYDHRNNAETKETKDIYKIASKPNMLGYKSARDCLNTSYIEATQELLLFIDEILMK